MLRRRGRSSPCRGRRAQGPWSEQGFFCCPSGATISRSSAPPPTPLLPPLLYIWMINYMSFFHPPHTHTRLSPKAHGPLQTPPPPNPGPLPGGPTLFQLTPSSERRPSPRATGPLQSPWSVKYFLFNLRPDIFLLPKDFRWDCSNSSTPSGLMLLHPIPHPPSPLWAFKWKQLARCLAQSHPSPQNVSASIFRILLNSDFQPSLGARPLRKSLESMNSLSRNRTTQSVGSHSGGWLLSAGGEEASRT